jgi:hypothetical protein
VHGCVGGGWSPNHEVQPPGLLNNQPDPGGAGSHADLSDIAQGSQQSIRERIGTRQRIPRLPGTDLLERDALEAEFPRRRIRRQREVSRG